MATKRLASQVSPSADEVEQKKPRVGAACVQPSATISDMPTELLEEILLHVDPKTLLLSQRTNKQWQAVIAGSTKLQKKLFFIQPTFKEAVDLGLIKNKSNIFSVIPGHAAFCNPLVMDIGHAGPYNFPISATCYIPSAIVLDREDCRSRSSSWERMWPTTKFRGNGSTEWYETDFWLEVEVLQILHGPRSRNCDDYMVGDKSLGHAYDWDMGPMGIMLKQIEQQTLNETGFIFSFASAELEMVHPTMRFEAWEKANHLAEVEEVDEWEGLSVFDNKRFCLPELNVIDEALEEAMQNQEASDGSGDEDSEFDDAEA